MGELILNHLRTHLGAICPSGGVRNGTGSQIVQLKMASDLRPNLGKYCAHLFG